MLYQINLYRDQEDSYSHDGCRITSLLTDEEYLLKNLYILHEQYVGCYVRILRDGDAHKADDYRKVYEDELTDEGILQWALEQHINNILPHGSGFDYDWDILWTDEDNHIVEASSLFHTMDAVGGYGPVVPVRAVFKMDERNEFPVGFSVPVLSDDVDKATLKQIGWESCLDDPNADSMTDDETIDCGKDCMGFIEERMSEYIETMGHLPIVELDASEEKNED